MFAKCEGIFHEKQKRFFGPRHGFGRRVLRRHGYLPPKRVPRPKAHMHALPLAPENVLVETPDVPLLPWRMLDGAKEFHLVAEPVRRRLISGREMQVWGYKVLVRPDDTGESR